MRLTGRLPDPSTVWGYGLLIYWIAISIFTIHLGQSPGYIATPENWRYPWSAVLTTCAWFAICIAILYWILRPTSYLPPWGSLAAATLYALALFMLGIAGVGTDLPGYRYAPAWFGLMTLAGTVVFAALQLLWGFTQWIRHVA